MTLTKDLLFVLQKQQYVHFDSSSREKQNNNINKEPKHQGYTVILT